MAPDRSPEFAPKGPQIELGFCPRRAPDLTPECAPKEHPNRTQDVAQEGPWIEALSLPQQGRESNP
jgi:hypothetical protein